MGISLWAEGESPKALVSTPAPPRVRGCAVSRCTSLPAGPGGRAAGGGGFLWPGPHSSGSVHHLISFVSAGSSRRHLMTLKEQAYRRRKWRRWGQCGVPQSLLLWPGSLRSWKKGLLGLGDCFPPSLNCVRVGVRETPGPSFVRVLAGCNWDQLCQALPLQAHWQKPQKPVAKLLCHPPAKPTPPCPETCRQDRLVRFGKFEVLAFKAGSFLPRQRASPPRFALLLDSVVTHLLPGWLLARRPMLVGS